MIADLADHLHWIPTLAGWHHAEWGSLTGAASPSAYEAMLARAATGRTVPSVIIALEDGALAGSISLLACDLPRRWQWTPWLAQLFVAPAHRRGGLGASLVRAALRRTQDCGYPAAYLYTSGTLPDYYARRGWRALDTVEHLGRPRTVMRYDLVDAEL